MPFNGSMDEFASGVFVSGRCLPETLLYRGKAAVPCPPQARLKGPCIFGGYMFAHFGHFLLESLSRYYAVARCKPWPLLFMSPDPNLRQWQKEALKILGITNRIHLIRVPTLVDELIISPPACDASIPMIDAQFEALGRLPERTVLAGKKNSGYRAARCPAAGWMRKKTWRRSLSARAGKSSTPKSSRSCGRPKP